MWLQLTCSTDLPIANATNIRLLECLEVDFMAAMLWDILSLAIFLSYTDVKDDCINVFANIPELFCLRTNFGGRRTSTITSNEYASFMQCNKLRQVNR